MTKTSRRAFTLTEMLIVIAIIVLVATIAVPSFRAMTGGRSTEAAQNQISAMLARARTEALGVQEARGVMFYRDPQTQRVGMATVRASSQAVPWALDLVADRDVVLLPNGVSVNGIDDYAGNRSDDGYIGFNLFDTTITTAPPYGPVILFDGQGRLVSDPFGFRVRYVDAGGNFYASEMAKFLYDNPSAGTGAADMIVPGSDPYSNIGLVLYESEEFNALHNDGRQADVDPQVSGGGYDATEDAEEDWLDTNATPLLVNRYNGTLLSGE